MIIYFDGSAKPNPGNIGWAAVSECGTVKVFIKEGKGTNNQAEWEGFLEAVSQACSLFCLKGLVPSEEPVIIRGDSALVVNQANGTWRVKDETLKIYHAAWEEQRILLPNIKVEWVPRNVNLAGIYIEQIDK